MSKKKYQTELMEKTGVASLDDNEKIEEKKPQPNVFYQFVCPECGKQELSVHSGVLTEFPLLGVDSCGEIGCSTTELDVDYQLEIRCRSCHHQVCGDSYLQDICSYEFLSEWATSNGQALPTLAFTCPKCDSQELLQVEVGIESSRLVVAVDESIAPRKEPLIAVDLLQGFSGDGTHRYRCTQRHELANDDGSPVGTAAELVAWLKAHGSAEKG